MGYDRNDVLAHISLDVLCDELLGPHKGRGGSARWPCPDAGHGPQTGATPPVTIFRPSSGSERWHCHGCGAGGTGIDLVMQREGIGFAAAMERLGRRVGVPETRFGDERSHNAERRPTPVAIPREPSPSLEAYVGACEAWLWGSNGRAMRRWLARRSFGEDVLRANRVGADPGPRALHREAGLPRGGVAVVFPLLDDAGRAVYAQARYLSPATRKYDNPSATVVPASPRFGEMRRPAPGHDAGVVLICEGIPDALSAVQAGWRATAVLGAGLPDERLAVALTDRFPDERLVLAFDADHRGRLGAQRLGELLTAAGAGSRVSQLDLPIVLGISTPGPNNKAKGSPKPSTALSRL